MTLGDIYKEVNFLINKDVSGNSFSPVEFTLVTKLVQLTMFSEAVAAENRPSNTAKADDDVSLFTPVDILYKSASLTTPYAIPSDLFHIKAASILGLNAVILDSDRWNTFTKHPFYESSRPPIKLEAGFIVCTTNPLQIDITYYRKWTNPIFDYITDTNGVIFYMEPKSLLVTNGANLDLVRAAEAYANSTAYSVGKRLTYGGLAWEVNTAVLNTNVTAPVDNPNSSFTLVGNIIIAATVTHFLPAGTNGYLSQSVELEIPEAFHNQFIQRAYTFAMTNLSKSVQQ